MAQDIVSGLFGLAPYQVAQQQQKEIDTDAAKFAQMNAAQRGTMGLYQGGAGLAGMAGGMLGIENPAMVEAQQRQAALQGLDISSPESIRHRALQIQDPKLKMQLMMVAQQQQEKKAERELNLAKAAAEWKKAMSEGSAIAKLNPKDYTQASWQEYLKSGGDTGKLVGLDTKGNWSEPYSLGGATVQKNSATGEIRTAVTRPPVTNINMPTQEKGFETELGKLQAKRLIEGAASAEDAAALIKTVQEGEKLLNSGVKTGVFANFKVGLGKTLKEVGIDYGGDEVANTEAFAANMAQNVGRIIKQFGSGTGLSDADRQYAQKMAGGEITLDEQSIRRILGINKKQANWVIAKQNALAKGVKTNVPLQVEVPAEEKAPAPTTSPSAEATKVLNGVTYVKRGGKWYSQ